jgi:autotransporter-associated beta strand protein
VNDAHVKLSASATTGARTIRTLSLAAASAPVTVTQSAGTTLTVSAGGVLKTGAGAAAITGGGVTASTPDLVFYVGVGGDLDVSSAVTGPIGVTKSGPGRLVFSGARANTYAGATYVNEGELLLSRSGAGTNAAVTGDVAVNGGTLRLGASNQIADAATVTLNAGQFRLEGNDERVKALVNSGGTFDAGNGKLDADTASITGGGQVILGLPPAAGSSAGAGGGGAAPAEDVRIVSTLGKASVESGRIRVLASAELQVGSGGLSFVGGGTPEIALEGGRLRFTNPLEGGISVSGSTRASITGTGDIDLNGKRVFCETEGSELTLSTLIQGGSFEKAGVGLVRLGGDQPTGPVTVSLGSLEVTDPLAITGSPLKLRGGTLALKLPYPSAGRTALGTNIELASSSAMTAEDVIVSKGEDSRPPSRMVLNSLTASGPGRLTVSSPTGVTVEFAGPAALAAGAEVANDSPVVLSGAITGAGSLTKRGVGVLTLGGASANAFGTAGSAALVVAGGSVELAQGPAGGASSSAPLAVAGDVSVTGGTLRLLGSEQIVDSAAVSLTGGTGPEAVLDLNGFTETVRSLSLAGQARVVTGGGSLRVTGSVGVGPGAKLSVDDGPAAAAGAPGARAGFGGKALVVTSLGAVDGTIDVRNNAMIVDYAAGGPSPLSAIAAWVASGRITSSVADAAGRTGVGYGEASTVLGESGGTFAGRAVDGSAVIVRYTMLGDATLDGRVNFDDLLVLAKHYNATGAAVTWDAGDFDGNRVVNFDDLLVLAKSYNGSVTAGPAWASPAFAGDWSAAQAAAAAKTAVPEPGGGAVLAAVGAGTALGGVGRRRARRGRGRIE